MARDAKKPPPRGRGRARIWGVRQIGPFEWWGDDEPPDIDEPGQGLLSGIALVALLIGIAAAFVSDLTGDWAWFGLVVPAGLIAVVAYTAALPPE